MFTARLGRTWARGATAAWLTTELTEPVRLRPGSCSDSREALRGLLCALSSALAGDQPWTGVAGLHMQHINEKLARELRLQANCLQWGQHWQQAGHC